MANAQAVEISEPGDVLFGKISDENGELTKEIFIDTAKLKKESNGLFKGVKVADKVKFDIQSLFENTEDLALAVGEETGLAEKMEGERAFEVEKMQRKVPAEMNQEFFDRIFGKDKVHSEEGFVKKYSDLIEKNYQKESDNLLSRDLQKKMLDTINLDLPQDFYKKWLLASNEGITQEDLEKDFEHYLRDLKWTLIKNRIAADNGIKAEHADVVNQTKEYFKEQYGMSDVNEEMDKNLEMLANNYLQQNNGEQYYNIYAQVFTNKIMDFVKQKADIDVKQVDREAFNKIVEN